MTTTGSAVPSATTGGAYGLRLTGLVPPAADLVTSAPETWPSWNFAYEQAHEARPAGWSDRLETDSADVALGTGSARIDRLGASTVLALPEEPTPAELTHPYLSATGAVAARWRGDLPLHSGAFLAGGRTWSLLGDREAGKSTTVAALWRAGAPIMTDDLLVVRGRTALAGPRSLDLREPTAVWLDAGEPMGVVGMRERWRIRLSQVPAEAPMGGFVVLGWGDGPALAPVPLPERPALLLAAVAVLAIPTDPAALLDLFTLPFWRLTRPRTLASLEPTADLLLETLGA